MANEKRDFDKDAATWDDPHRVRITNEISSGIQKLVSLYSSMDVLDFGCGTGLLAFSLLPFVRSVTGIDNSKGMVDIFRQKAERLNLNNTASFVIDIDHDQIPGEYDLIVSSMALHHIPDTFLTIGKLVEKLKPSGVLCIADLDSDNGLFHPNSDGVFHNGFFRNDIKSLFTQAGLIDVKDSTAAEVTKPGADGVVRTFTIFAISGRKHK